MSLSIIRGGGNRRRSGAEWEDPGWVRDQSPTRTTQQVIEPEPEQEKRRPIEDDLIRQGAVVFEPTPFGFR